MSDLIQELRKQAGRRAPEHRLKFGGKIKGGIREQFLEWEAADALEQAQDEIEKHHAQYANIAGYLELRDKRIEQLEAALTRCIDELEENLQFEGPLASFRVAIKIGRKALDD